MIQSLRVCAVFSYRNFREQRRGRMQSTIGETSTTPPRLSSASSVAVAWDYWPHYGHRTRNGRPRELWYWHMASGFSDHQASEAPTGSRVQFAAFVDTFDSTGRTTARAGGSTGRRGPKSLELARRSRRVSHRLQGSSIC